MIPGHHNHEDDEDDEYDETLSVVRTFFCRSRLGEGQKKHPSLQRRRRRRIRRRMTQK
jgi:hypothetical protein